MLFGYICGFIAAFIVFSIISAIKPSKVSLQEQFVKDLLLSIFWFITVPVNLLALTWAGINKILRLKGK